MGDSPDTVPGGCMCGAVRYEADGEPLKVGLPRYAGDDEVEDGPYLHGPATKDHADAT